jgi:GTP-binding protein
VPLALVAIAGAPNVGKSTLFNRLVGRRRSIVTDEPGVTRDRVYGEVHDAPRPFRLVDTGGLAPDPSAPFAREIENQALVAIDEAAVVLFVVDARAGASALDHEIATMLRRRASHVVLVANKIDGPSHEGVVLALAELGLGDAVAISAEHGRGIDTLLDRVDQGLGQDVIDAPSEEVDDGDRPVRVALVGRPNVGKSSLLNRLVGEDRMMVSDIPGTTRDAVDTLLERDGRRYLLVDTAGIRRRGRARQAAEVVSVVLARRSIARADVVVLLIDASDGFAAQDAHIAGLAVDALKPLVVAVNKWDLIEGREEAARHWEEEIRYRLRFAKKVPMVLVSALTGQRVLRILDLVDEAHEGAGRRIPTAELNRWLQDVSKVEQSSPARGRSINLLYATQIGARPLRFVVFCRAPRKVHFSLRRFLTNSLRDRFDLGASPIDLRFRRGRSRG